MEYLYNAKTHPKVEEIYSALKKEVPSLSKNTIYNTLNYLSELNIIKSLIIDENEARFDGVTDNHGHFKCSKCGKIYDFDINMDALAADRLDNFEINEKTVYFNGNCS